MTNAEKFEEVFGIKIAEDYPGDICQSIDPNICVEHSCSDCPIFKFWDQEYVEKVTTNESQWNVKNILVDLQLEIEENVLADDPNSLLPFLKARETCIAVIQQKINKLKGKKEESHSIQEERLGPRINHGPKF